jgi:hypothetical protein
LRKSMIYTRANRTEIEKIHVFCSFPAVHQMRYMGRCHFASTLLLTNSMPCRNDAGF